MPSKSETAHQTHTILRLAQPSVSSAFLVPLVLSRSRPCKSHRCLAAPVQLPPRQVHFNSSKLMPGLARYKAPKACMRNIKQRPYLHMRQSLRLKLPPSHRKTGKTCEVNLHFAELRGSPCDNAGTSITLYKSPL